MLCSTNVGLQGTNLKIVPLKKYVMPGQQNNQTLNGDQMSQYRAFSETGTLTLI